MKKLNLIQLAENELLNIKGGESGGGGSGCSCDSCSCNCGEGGTIHDQTVSNITGSATSYTSNSSSIK